MSECLYLRRKGGRTWRSGYLVPLLLGRVFAFETGGTSEDFGFGLFQFSSRSGTSSFQGFLCNSVIRSKMNVALLNCVWWEVLSSVSCVGAQIFLIPKYHCSLMGYPQPSNPDREGNEVWKKWDKKETDFDFLGNGFLVFFLHARHKVIKLVFLKILGLNTGSGPNRDFTSLCVLVKGVELSLIFGSQVTVFFCGGWR